MDNKKNAKTNKKVKQSSDAESYMAFLCAGLAGFGCGTDPKKVAQHRRVLTWEERQRRFLERDGD